MRPATETTTTDNVHTTKGTHHTKQKSSSGAGRGLAAILVPLLLLHFLALLCLCAAVTNYWINGNSSALTAFAYVAVPAMVLLTLIATSVGVATLIMSMIHGKHEAGAAKSHRNTTSGSTTNYGAHADMARHSTLASNLVTFGLLALAFGFACKVLAHGLPGSTIGRLLKAIAALVIISTIVHLLYLFALGLFKKHTDHHDAVTTSHHHEAGYAAPVAAGTAGYGAGHHGTTGRTTDYTTTTPATGHHNACTTGYGTSTNTNTLAGNNTNLGGGDVRSLESGTHPTAGHKNFVGGHEVP